MQKDGEIEESSVKSKNYQISISELLYTPEIAEISHAPVGAGRLRRHRQARVCASAAWVCASTALLLTHLYL